MALSDKAKQHIELAVRSPDVGSEIATGMDVAYEKATRIGDVTEAELATLDGVETSPTPAGKVIRAVTSGEYPTMSSVSFDVATTGDTSVVSVSITRFPFVFKFASRKTGNTYGGVAGTAPDSATWANATTVELQTKVAWLVVPTSAVTSPTLTVPSSYMTNVAAEAYSLGAVGTAPLFSGTLVA